MPGIQLSSWDDVAAFLSQQAAGTRICINKGFLPHPQVYLMAPVIYPPQGQLATYYKMLSPTIGLLVRDFGRYYDAQIDFRPYAEVEDPGLTTAMTTNPQQLIAGGTALGAAIGSALGRTDKSVAAAALFGGAIAALLYGASKR